MTTIFQCPVCKGSGGLEKPAHLTFDKGGAARILHREGYSYRQIGVLLSIKSPRSVQLLVHGEQETHKEYKAKPVDAAQKETTMSEYKIQLIHKALSECHGNRREAAKKLGISERTIYRKLKENQPTP